MSNLLKQYQLQQLLQLMEESSRNSLLNSSDHEKSLEGQVRIASSRFIKINKFKAYFVLPLLTVLSAFIIFFIIRKNKKLIACLIGDECQQSEATHILIIGNDSVSTLQSITTGTFYYRKVKYSTKFLQPVNYNLENSAYFQSINNLSAFEGLTEEQYHYALKTYGPCQHTVDIPNIFQYLIEELLGIFFILQYITCVIYILESLITFSIIMLSFSLLTTIINYFIMRSSYLKIKEIAQCYFKVDVVRNNIKVQIDSKDLVPGDIFIPKGVLPCDCLLIQGQAFLNQVNMTGQNIPISKMPLNEKLVQKLTPQNWMFEGSTILEARGELLALVIHTGFITRKGRIFRKLLFRENKQPQFFKYAFVFLIQVFILCLITYCAMIPIMMEKHISRSLMVLRFFDMFGWAIPPALPIFFNLCYSFSMYRLRQSNIFGTEPFKTIVSGKIKTMCFDKTGTLTKNAMELHSIVEFLQQNRVKQTIVKQNNQLNDVVQKIMASCHSVRLLNKQYMGDELDLRMFLFSQYQYKESVDIDIKLILKKSNISLEVLKINQFQSKFQDMSVLVREGNQHYVYVKGAPEKIYTSSLNKNSNFDKILSQLSLAGLRCLAIGYKKVNDPHFYLNSQRKSFNEGITMCGLITFSNELKQETIETINKMYAGGIESKIITGDNVYIGVETAMRTGIVQGNDMMVFRGEKQNQKTHFLGQRLVKIGNKITIDQIKIDIFQFPQNISSPIAVDESFIINSQIFPTNAKVFARISPEYKAHIVKKLIQKQNSNWRNQSFCTKIFSRTAQKVGMCGDGANDIMAIKQADIGIGINNTDSSFAGNFVVTEIIDVDLIIREGKATLQNVIEIFRYYAGISVIKFVGSMISLADRSSLTDNMYTYFNYASTLEIVLFLCLSKPIEQMCTSYPNDNLMSLQNHLIFIGLILIETAGLIGMTFFLQSTPTFLSNYGQNQISTWIFSSQTATGVFLFINILFVCHTLFVYRAKPWKKAIWFNYVLTVWTIIVIIPNIVLFFFTKNLTPFFGIVELEWNVQVNLFGITLGTVGVGLIWRIITDLTKLHQK